MSKCPALCKLVKVQNRTVPCAYSIDIHACIKSIKIESIFIKFTHLNVDDDEEGCSSSTAAISKINSLI